MLRAESPRWQFVIDVVFAVCVGVVFVVFLLGLAACEAHAQSAAPDPLASLVGALDPLTEMAAKLGGAGALIHILLEGAKRHVPFLNAGTERAGLWLYLSALGLGAVFGLVGAVEPMPGHAVAGALISGLGAGTVAVSIHSGRRAVENARAEKKAKT